MNQEKKGFWALGPLLLLLFLVSLVLWLPAEREYLQAEKEKNALWATLVEKEADGTATKEDRDRAMAASDRYWTLHHRHILHSRDKSMSLSCGIGLFLWALTAAGKLILHLAQGGVEREQRRQEDPWNM